MQPVARVVGGAGDAPRGLNLVRVRGVPYLRARRVPRSVWVHGEARRGAALRARRLDWSASFKLERVVGLQHVVYIGARRLNWRASLGDACVRGCAAGWRDADER